MSLALENCSGALDGFKRARSIFRVHVHGAGGIDDDVDLKPGPQAVEGCFPNAVVLGESSDPEPFDSCSAEFLEERCSSKRRIAIFIRLVTLADDFGVRRKMKTGVKRGA